MKARRIRLVVPAYSLAEPYETLARHQKNRKKLKEEFDFELDQIARSTTFQERLLGFRDLTALLNVADESAKQLEAVRSRMISAACVIPLDSSVLASACSWLAKQAEAKAGQPGPVSAGLLL